MEKTDAESVDAIVEANSKEVNRPTPADAMVIPRIYQIAIPVSIAVRNTPNVANRIPFAAIGRISEYCVSKPPEKRIIHNATVPIAFAN